MQVLQEVPNLSAAAAAATNQPESPPAPRAAFHTAHGFEDLFMSAAAGEDVAEAAWGYDVPSLGAPPPPSPQLLQVRGSPARPVRMRGPRRSSLPPLGTGALSLRAVAACTLACFPSVVCGELRALWAAMREELAARMGHPPCAAAAGSDACICSW